MSRRLTAGQARRLAVTAQGLADPRPSEAADVRHLRRVLRRVSVLQIDSVNVVDRAHHLTLFSRIGPFDREAFRRYVEVRRELFEYWGHMASFNPAETWPLLRPRMERLRGWGSVDRLRRERPEYIDGVLADVAARGPLTAADLSDPGEARAGTWWDWRTGKLALEWLFAKGLVTVSHRTAGFARAYDLPERVIPERYRTAPVPSGPEAARLLVQRSIRSMGVATRRDLIDYYRLPAPEGTAAVDSLAADGRLVPVEVEGWSETAYLDPEASIPRRVGARALLCPFDSLIWYRPRAERVFGFTYRVEIYVPRPQRRYGYYVFPFLLDDRLAARADLKADRGAGLLRVPGVYAEEGSDPAETAGELAMELREMASWLGLEAVAVGERGDLAAPLARALG